MLTQAEVREMFSYDSNTGYLIRKKWVHGCRENIVGNMAGGLNARGYLRISIRKKRYYSHRLVWLYVHGALPEHDLDHINGNKSDNRIDNLRYCTQAENQQNRTGLQKNNTSGHPGVYWYDPNHKWSGKICIKRKIIHLGYFDTIEEAIAARKAAKKIYHQFNPIDP